MSSSTNSLVLLLTTLVGPLLQVSCLPSPPPVDAGSFQADGGGSDAGSIAPSQEEACLALVRGQCELEFRCTPASERDCLFRGLFGTSVAECIERQNSGWRTQIDCGGIALDPFDGYQCETRIFCDAGVDPERAFACGATRETMDCNLRQAGFRPCACGQVCPGEDLFRAACINDETAQIVCRDGDCNCEPACYSRTCGDDGCGGSCDVCDEFPNSRCSVNGSCECMPDCDQRQCGSDGCGGECENQCPEAYNAFCNDAGMCDCDFPCAERVCGVDDCGLPCGTCPDDGTVCSYQQQCLPPVVDVSVEEGYYAGCSIDAAGTLGCWGPAGTPIEDVPVGTFVDVDVGSQLAACAIRSDRTLSCWGSNEGIVAGAPTAAGVKNVDMTLWGACALFDDGSGACWGDDNPLLVRQFPAGTYARISAYYVRACGITSDAGSIDCWGYPFVGGDGGAVAAPAGHFAQIAVGTYNACAIRTDGGTLQCWGASGFAEAIHTNVGSAKVINVVCGERSTYVRKADGTAVFIGESFPYNDFVFDQVSLGREWGCGIRSGGTIDCWNHPRSEWIGPP